MEGFWHYRLGGLIFGGAYTWRGLFSEFYGILMLGIPYCFVLFENHPLLLRISLAENITLFDKHYVDTNKICHRSTSNSYGMSVWTKKKRSCEQEAA